jgi:PTS system mannose-specific IIB component/fructoselysine and glucoselysine-specific PTS system IIB component
VPVDLFRIDDRRIHGQVVVGWGQPLDLRFIVLVDDEVAASDWEQELYRMGVPPGMDVYFESVATAPGRLTHLAADPRHGMLLTSDIDTMRALTRGCPSAIHAIHIGGIHHRPGRTQRLRYVFLTPSEEDALRALAECGITVTAQDVPGARPIALDELLAAHGVVSR